MRTLDRRTLLAGSAGLLGLGMLTLAGCARTQDDPPPSETPPPDPFADVDPIVDELPQLTLTRLFGEEVVSTSSFYSMRLVGGRVLVYDDSGATEGRLLALDAATGATVWAWRDAEPAIEADDPRVSAFAPSSFVVAGPADDRLLLASTYVNPCPDNAGICSSSSTDATEGSGIVAIGIGSGDVRWHALVQPPVDRGDPASTLANDTRVEPVGGTAAIVVARAGLSDYAFDPSTAPAREDRARTVGLSVVDGAVAWERPGLVAVSVGVVVVALRDDRGETVQVVLDPETGEDLWQAERGQAIGTPHEDAEGLVVSDGERAWIVDARSGDAIVELGDGPELADAALSAQIGTDVDGAPLVAWVAAVPEVESQHLLWSSSGDEPRPGVEPIDDAARVLALRDGYVWCTETNGIHARDRSGAARSEAVSGSARGFADDRVLMQADAGFAVYAIA